MNSTDPNDNPASWPARPGHIPPRIWLLAVNHVRQHALEFTYFWPCWTAVYRKYLKQISDGSRSDVFYALFTIYQLAGGGGAPYEPAAEAGVAGPVRAAETAALAAAVPGRLEPERR
jgi:hypothetical protein